MEEQIEIKLLQARNLLSEIFNAKMKEWNGTKEFTLLCQAMSNLQMIMSRLENPEKHNKIDRILEKK